MEQSKAQGKSPRGNVGAFCVTLVRVHRVSTDPCIPDKHGMTTGKAATMARRICTFHRYGAASFANSREGFTFAAGTRSGPKMLYLFYLLATVSVISALVVVAAKSPINSVIALVVCFLSIAGHYILLNAQFLAMVHVIVYTGAILVLMLFVIMLLNMNSLVEQHRPLMARLLAVATGGLLLLVLLAAVRQGLSIPPPESQDPGIGLVRHIGTVLFREYLLPFEVSSVLFLSAMAGAMMLAKRDGTDHLNLPPSSEPQDNAA